MRRFCKKGEVDSRDKMNNVYSLIFHSSIEIMLTYKKV